MGKFTKGHSGNPGGRPKAADDVKALAREYTTEAITKLAEWMRSDNAKASVSACSVLLDRGWGKAEQRVEAEVNHNYIARMPAPAKDGTDWQQQHAAPLKTPTLQ